MLHRIFIVSLIVRTKMSKVSPEKKKNGRGVANSNFENTGELNDQFTGVFTKT